MTTYLLGGIAHGHDDGEPTTWCGLAFPEGAPEWNDDDEGCPVCPTCLEHDQGGALDESAALLAENPDIRAIVGPCGQHILTFTADLRILRATLAGLPRGYRIVRPTAEQVLGLLGHNRRCDLCTPAAV